MHEHFALILILLAIAVATTAVAKKLNQPYPISLVIVGVFIGLLPIEGLESLKDFVAEDEIFRFTIISIFLPTLLGEAALKLPYSQLKENRTPIITLALGGMVISFLTVGVFAELFLGLNLQVAFVFAALIAATDPISVLSIFKRLGVDKRLATVIEGESLFNDGIAVVLFNIAAFSLMEYLHLGVTGFVLGAIEFIKVAFGGAVVGGALGYLFSKLTKFYDDYPLEIIFSMLLFYGAFFIAEQFHLSGVIATVVAGIIFGNYGGEIGMSPTTKLNINNFWDVAALLANSMVFLMVGLEIARIDLTSRWGGIGMAIVIVLAARSAAVYITLFFVRNFPPAWKHILNWGGLKGSLSIALALSLPLEFPAREEVVVAAFSVVLFSLVVQGLSIKPLIAWLNIISKKSGLPAYEDHISKIHRYKSALKKLNVMKDEALVSEYVYERLKKTYNEKLDYEHASLEKLYSKFPSLIEEQFAKAHKQALYSEYDAVEELAAKNIISDATAGKQKEQIIDMIEG